MIRRNILIFHLGALGDFLLTWPLAMALGRLHPQSRIIYITHAQKGKLAERILGLDSAGIEGGWHHLYGNPHQLPPPATRLLEGAKSVYSFIADPDDTWSRHALEMSGGAEVHCLRPPIASLGPGLHASEHLIRQLAPLPALEQAVRQMVQSIRHRGVGRRNPVPRSVVIHPGSGSPDKCWPSERFAELGRRLGQRGYGVRILLGETEAERWTEGSLAQFEGVGEVCHLEDVLELQGQIGEAGLFIGNDSGPGHLAGMLGVPTISLFGPTDPAIWRPLGPRVSVLQGSPLSGIPVDSVEALAIAALNE